jgi:hypothetical protein
MWQGERCPGADCIALQIAWRMYNACGLVHVCIDRDPPDCGRRCSYDAAAVWAKIEDLVVHTFVGARQHLDEPACKCNYRCYKLYGPHPSVRSHPSVSSAFAVGVRRRSVFAVGGCSQ